MGLLFQEIRTCDGRAKAERQDEMRAHVLIHKQEAERANWPRQESFETLSLLPVIHPQDHTSWSFPSNSTNWGPSIQARTSMGNILIKPTTAHNLHLCLLYHIHLFKLLSKSSLKSSSFIKPSKSLCTRIMYQCQRKSLGYVFKIWDILLFYSTYIYILFVRFLKTFSQHECPWIFFEFAKWL